MRRSIPLLALSLAACATTGTPDEFGSERATTTISGSAGGAEGSVGSSTMTLSRTADNTGVTSQIAATPDRVVQALREVYPQVGIEVGTLDTNQRLVGNRQIRATRRLGQRPLSAFVRCGTTATGAPAEDQYRVQMDVLSRVRPAGQESTLETRVQATATAQGQNTSVACTSTGVLEETIAKGVQLKAATSGS